MPSFSSIKTFYICLFLVGTINLYPQLKINELMPNNVSAVWDDAYNHSMWVELYNPSVSLSFNQSSYYFTDNLAEPRKWQPVSKTITPGGYSVLWFERDERAGHAKFKLEPEGGKLYMLNSLAQIMDSVTYPKQYRNISYGRKADGSPEWVFFEEHSAGTSNTGKSWSKERCTAPIFTLPGGFYHSAQAVGFVGAAAGDTIYYTLDGTEPTRNHTRHIPGNYITVTKTTVLRAKTFSAGKLSSDIKSTTYLLNERNFKLPVVSIITEPANLTDNTTGIYVQGTNGITGNGMNTPANWNQDWDRPANFELYDTTFVNRLNQELDISIAGGWTRMRPQKSLKIEPRKKFGNNKLDYDIFAASKPNQKYKSILFRNSGNDFEYSMLRDGFMNSLVAKRMDLDYIAYEPAVCFMNGVYYGIQNLRERSKNDYIYSNYGLDEEDIYMVESAEMATDTSFTRLTNYLTANDITKPEVYEKVCQMMDIDSYMNYFMTEIYYGNTDWPHNNTKAWKRKSNGKWRWILYDTDFGYSLYDAALYNHNTLIYALGELTSKVPAAWSTLILRRLILNETFRNKFIDRFSIHASTTFETKRANAVLDSLAAKISTEIVYHKAKWGSNRTFANDLNTMKTFSAQRPAKIMEFIGARFLGSAPVHTVNLSANVPGATYKMNGEMIIDQKAAIKSFRNRSLTFEANPVRGQKFSHWELVSTSSSIPVKTGDEWKYYDGNSMPATNWYSPAYSGTGWKSGVSPLGYGGRGEVTTIGYGSSATNKNITAYFRKTITLNQIASKSNFNITVVVDDAVALYVNGSEIGRFNLPSGTLGFSTLATTYAINNGETVMFSIPANLLREGENLIAAEVHQNSASSSDLLFNCELSYNTNIIEQTVQGSFYSTTLTGDFNLKAVYEKADFEVNEEVIVINEVVSSQNILADEFGEKDDYIELYNTGDENVNIAGWFITDTPLKRKLVQIPTGDDNKTTIPGKGRIILWADGQPAQGLLHLGFKLGREGETVILSCTENTTHELVLVDSVSYPEMPQNMSYSRVPDGAGIWMVQSTTFNKTNTWVSELEATNTSEAQVYPTLVSGYITITNANGMNVRITDLTGKIVHNEKCVSDNEIVRLGNLQRGMYIISVGNSNFKIIKK